MVVILLVRWKVGPSILRVEMPVKRKFVRGTGYDNSSSRAFASQGGGSYRDITESLPVLYDFVGGHNYSARVGRNEMKYTQSSNRSGKSGVPTVAASWLSGSAFALSRNTLEFYSNCERIGGLVKTHIWRLPVY